MLCGGASRRMGRPKALVPVDGLPMAARVAAAMRAAGVAAPAVVLVGGDPAWAAQLELGWVADRWPGQGPLGGLATALLDAPGAAGAPGRSTIVLVAACDQPWLTGGVLGSLVDALAASPAAGAATAWAADGGRQPFPAAWRSSHGPQLDALVSAGERRADAAFGVAEVFDVAIEARFLADVDRPGDLPPVP